MSKQTVSAQQFSDALVRARLVTAEELPLIRKLTIVVEPLKPVMVHIEKLGNDGVLQVVREFGPVNSDD